MALFFPPKEPVKGEFQHGGTSTSTSPGSEFTQIFSFDREFAAPLGPADEVSVDPMLKPLEVLERWTDDKVITVLQRKLVIRNDKGERVVDAEKFFIGPAVDITRMTVLKPGDLLTTIRIPNTWAGATFYFEKVADREVWDFALVNIAAAMKVSGGVVQDIRVCCGGVEAV